MPTIDNLPPLKDIVSKYNLYARKSLGQNFLFDLNLINKIVTNAGDVKGKTILEVGPGPGGLTRILLHNGAKKVVTIEKDERCIDALAYLSEIYASRLVVINGDALKIDYTKLFNNDDEVMIIANLPYNVATPLLLNWLAVDPWPPWYKSMTLMFQKEVAQRITADIGSKSYGRLSIVSQWRCFVECLFDISPKAFLPSPKVTSTVVNLTPKRNINKCKLSAIEAVTASAFGQRRKMLRTSLKRVFSCPEEELAKIGIIATKRAEELSIEEYCHIASFLDNKYNKGQY